MTRPIATVQNAEQILSYLFEHARAFQNDEEGTPPIPHTWQRGNCNMVLVVGENATGKSVFRRMVCQIAKESNHDPMSVSMEGRTSAGFVRVAVYGTEDYDSTGQNSARAILKGIQTCKESENTHVIFWDEPDIGLSDSFAAGAGIAFRKLAESMPKNTIGAFIVTHSKILARQLASASPHFVSLGENRAESLEQWLLQEVSPKDLESLSNESLRLFRRINRIQNRGK